MLSSRKWLHATARRPTTTATQQPSRSSNIAKSRPTIKGSSGLRVEEEGFRLEGLGFGVKGLGLRV